MSEKKNLRKLTGLNTKFVCQIPHFKRSIYNEKWTLLHRVADVGGCIINTDQRTRQLRTSNELISAYCIFWSVTSATVH